MELQGKVITALPQRSGTNQRGEWVAQDFVIETHDTYPRKMVFSVLGADRLQRLSRMVRKFSWLSILMLMNITDVGLTVFVHLMFVRWIQMPLLPYRIHSQEQ